MRLRASWTWTSRAEAAAADGQTSRDGPISSGVVDGALDSLPHRQSVSACRPKKASKPAPWTVMGVPPPTRPPVGSRRRLATCG